MTNLFRTFALTVLLCMAATPAATQPMPPREKIDSAAVARIIDEGMNRSHVMDMISWLTDVCGPRLTWSGNYRHAMTWVMETLKGLGLANVHTEGWTPMGYSWEVERYSAHVVAPTVFPLLSYPKAWSPGTGGTRTGEVVYLNAKTDSALETYRGKLKGKFVLLSDSIEITAHFEPQAQRESDSSLLAMANADVRQPRRRSFRSGDWIRRRMLQYQRLLLCQEEKAAGLLSGSKGDGGDVFVQDAMIPDHPDTPYTRSKQAFESDGRDMLPQVAVASEHYNRMLRMLERGQKVQLEMNLDVALGEKDSGYNVIGEIPGTDLKDEVVMIGAHLDSWHGGTGATDNATGVASCMEAMRILKTLGLTPRRTIRIGLWGGEEEGVYGSRAYVRTHLGELKQPDDTSAPGPRKIVTLPEADRFSAYFNNDNGTGKIRGIYMQGNESLRPIFRAWFAPFNAMGASTLTLLPTGSTDHVPFDAIGLPAFQFIQDDIEYTTRTWHSTMDVYDRAQPEDVKQASVIMAAFAYNAAMRDERLPRKVR